jgi:hypothetical protein
VSKLLALLYLVLSLFGIDVAGSADALCRHTLLPGVCAVKPAVRRHLPTTAPHHCARVPAGTPASDASCKPPRPRAAAH